MEMREKLCTGSSGSIIEQRHPERMPLIMCSLCTASGWIFSGSTATSRCQLWLYGVSQVISDWLYDRFFWKARTFSWREASAGP